MASRYAPYDLPNPGQLGRALGEAAGQPPMTTSQHTHSFVTTTPDTWDRASPGPASRDYPRVHEQDLSAFNFLGEDPWVTTHSFSSVTQPSQWDEDALSAQNTYFPQCGPFMYPAPQTPGERNATRLSRLTETLLCLQPTSNPSSPGWPGAYLGPSNTPSFASPVEDALGLHSDGEYDSSSPHTPSPRSEGGHHDFDNSGYNFGASPVVAQRSPTNYPFVHLSRVEEPQLLQQAGTPQIQPKQNVLEASRHLRVPAPGQVEMRSRDPRRTHNQTHRSCASNPEIVVTAPDSRLQQSRPRRASEGAHKAAAQPAALPSRGAWIPQTKYQLPVTEDTEEIFEPEPPILFFSNVLGDAGVSLNDLLTTGPKTCLANCRELPFRSSHVSVCFRLEWPGYPPWKDQMPTLDYKSPRRPITHGTLAKHIARYVAKWLKHVESKSLQGTQPEWRVGGEDGIQIQDILLVSFDHVSKGSWQPQLRLQR